MERSNLPVVLVAASVVGFGAPVAAQKYGQLGGCSEEPLQFHQCATAKAKEFNPPRTPDGKPDFRGYWSRAGVFGTGNIEGPDPRPGERNDTKSQVVDPTDGKIPYQPWAAAAKAAYENTYMDPAALCYLPGSPKQLYTAGVNQILQTPDSVIFINDYTHAYRVIPTDGRPRLAPDVRLFMGTSRGRWEGNTLVVEVTNQNAKTWFDHMGNFFSDAVHVVERWTMIGPDAIHFEARIDDPKVYTRPWTMAFGLRRNADPEFEMWENACHEGNVLRWPASDLTNHLQLYFGTTPPN
jgi:hypothetical protein